MKVEQGNGLAQIVAEELDDAAAYERDKERIDDATRASVDAGRSSSSRSARSRPS